MQTPQRSLFAQPFSLRYLGWRFIISLLTACYIHTSTFLRCDPSIHTHCDDKQAILALSSSVSGKYCQTHGAKPGWQYSLVLDRVSANKNSVIPSQSSLLLWSPCRFRQKCCYMMLYYIKPTGSCQQPLTPSPSVNDKLPPKCFEILKHDILSESLERWHISTKCRD